MHIKFNMGKFAANSFMEDRMVNKNIKCTLGIACNLRRIRHDNVENLNNGQIIFRYRFL